MTGNPKGKVVVFDVLVSLKKEIDFHLNGGMSL